MVCKLIRPRRASPSVRAPYLHFPPVSKCALDKPPASMENNTTISAVIHLLGVSVISHLISRRILVEGAQFSLRRASWPRLCVLIIFLDSYLFLFTTGILILGVGMATSAPACSLGIYLCIVFYGTSKFFIYLFLSEFPLSLASGDCDSIRFFQSNVCMSFGVQLPRLLDYVPECMWCAQFSSLFTWALPLLCSMVVFQT